MTASDYCYVLNGDGEVVKLYRTEAERELLPEEEREFYTSTLADDEFLIIFVWKELTLVTAAIIESWPAFREAEFESKFGFSVEQAWQMLERIRDIRGSLRRNLLIDQPIPEFERLRDTFLKIYCGPEEFEQLEDRKRHLYGTSPDVDSWEAVYAVSIGELEAFASLVAFSLEVVDDWEYELRLDVTPEYARNVVRQMEQILQELRAGAA